jgi:hypothetical protein
MIKHTAPIQSKTLLVRLIFCYLSLFLFYLTTSILLLLLLLLLLHTNNPCAAYV